MKKGMNRKGQDLSIGTLILIVLGIIVLVLLVLGFSLGWGNLWEKINIFGGSTSIADVATACNLAVTQQNNYGFCQDFKKIKVNGKTEYLNCEDTRVSASLTNGRLTCAGDTSARVKEKCKQLILSGDGKEDTKVNGQICVEYKCVEDYNGQLIQTDTCPSTDTSKTKSIKELKDMTPTETCCVAP